MGSWDTSHIDRYLRSQIATGRLSEKDRSQVYKQVFVPNKKYYINGWGEKILGRPGMFSIN